MLQLRVRWKDGWRDGKIACPVNPLLFTIVTHPTLVNLLNMAMEEELFGVMLQLGKPCIVQPLTNDYIIFFTPNWERQDMCEIFLKCFRVEN